MAQYTSNITDNYDAFLRAVQDLWRRINRSIRVLSEVCKYFEAAHLSRTRTNSVQAFI
jgi:hypothetical protein